MTDRKNKKNTTQGSNTHVRFFFHPKKTRISPSTYVKGSGKKDGSNAMTPKSDSEVRYKNRTSTEARSKSKAIGEKAYVEIPLTPDASNENAYVEIPLMTSDELRFARNKCRATKRRLHKIKRRLLLDIAEEQEQENKGGSKAESRQKKRTRAKTASYMPHSHESDSTMETFFNSPSSCSSRDD